jgi:transposase-like protein
MANTIRDPGREAFWRQTLANFRKSGLSVREFCRREKLHESAFYAWRRTIRERGPKHGRKPPAFVPLVFGEVHTAASITLELRGGRSLHLSESFPVERLASLVLALEAAEARP